MAGHGSVGVIMKKLIVAAVVFVLLVLYVAARVPVATKGGVCFCYGSQHFSMWQIEKLGVGSSFHPQGVFSVTGKSDSGRPGRHIIGQHQSLDCAIIQALLGWIPAV